LRIPLDLKIPDNFKETFEKYGDKQPTPSTGKQDWEIITWYSPEKQVACQVGGSYDGNIKAGYTIRSVKRLSDGVVFSVGENTSKGIIHAFNYRPDINELYLEVVVGDQNTLLRTLSKLPPEQPSTVTDNSDVACLSLNDLLDAWHSWEEKKEMHLSKSYQFYVDGVKYLPLYKRFEKKVKEKLKQL
jgi:hypothetical protein